MELQETPTSNRRPARALAAACFGAATAGAATLGRASTAGASTWYRALRKPPYQPPPQAFPVAWTALYGLIAASGYRVWRSRSSARRPALALWAAQLALNAAWSPLFFWARRPRAALVDAALLVPAVAGYAAAARRADRTAAWLVVPYLGWTSFALVLNAGIVRRNRSWLARR